MIKEFDSKNNYDFKSKDFLVLSFNLIKNSPDHPFLELG